MLRLTSPSSSLAGQSRYTTKDLDAYVKRFHERAWNVVIQWLEKSLLMFGLIAWWEYRTFLENLFFFLIFQVMEEARHTSESVRRTLTSNSANRLSPMIRHAARKRWIDTTFGKGKRARPSSSKRSFFDKKGPKEYPVLSLFPRVAKRAISLLNIGLKVILWQKKALCSAFSLSTRSKMQIIAHIIKEMAYFRSVRIFQRGYLMKSTRRVKYCSKRMKLSISTSYSSPNTKTEAKSMWWWPPMQIGTLKET